MERQDYIDQINDLKASNRRLMDMIDTLKQKELCDLSHEPVRAHCITAVRMAFRWHLLI